MKRGREPLEIEERQELKLTTSEGGVQNRHSRQWYEDALRDKGNLMGEGSPTGSKGVGLTTNRR